MIEQFDLGDTVQMRKPHPCGSNAWTIIRTGADVKIKCCGCSRIVMLSRADFQKGAVRILQTKEGEK